MERGPEQYEDGRERNQSACPTGNCQVVERELGVVSQAVRPSYNGPQDANSSPSEDSDDGAIDLQAITDIARRRILEGQLD